MNFRSFLKDLEQEGELKHVKEEISPKYEIPGALKNSENALLFENPKGYEMRVAGNVYSSRERIARGLGIDRDQLIDKMRGSLSNPKKPTMTSGAPVQEIMEDEVNLRKIPILKHFEKDGGPYVTSGIILGKDSEGNRNLSFHRLQLIGRDKFAVRLVPRHLYKMFEESEKGGDSLEIAAVLGADIGTSLAAATSPPYEVDEYGIAGQLCGKLKLTECQTVGLEVPAHAEIVMEGRLLAGERVPEGPFADITGTYDPIRQQPVFKVDRITRRKDAIYPGLLPGSSEHQLLMGTPREPLIYEEVNEVTRAKNVILTPGGCGWLHGVVSIDKQEEGDGKKAIEASFKGHPSLKHVVITDADIDIYDSKQVEWAIATRARADRDIVIKSDVKGSSLDPTADPKTRLGGKMGIDATKDLENLEKFERARIPV